jgi:hypothetical protein
MPGKWWPAAASQGRAEREVLRDIFTAEPDDALGADGMTVAERAALPVIDAAAAADELDLAHADLLAAARTSEARPTLAGPEPDPGPEAS